ncbi:MAG: hypothetical protein RL095_278 [Verrucomicrobiota bacterium]|jgi:hypothetical protein
MDSSPSYTTGAVIFLDVLGTAQRTRFDDKFRIHRLFHEEVGRNKARQAQLPHVIYQRELRSFSDCVYIVYTYKDGVEDARKNDLNLLYICLYNTSLSILRILNEGFLVRGGAVLGDCYIDDLGFFGPSVECAYFLESKKAIYPRVMIEDDIGARLYEWERSQEMDETMAKKFKSIPRLILQDDDGHFFLNALYEVEKAGQLYIGEEKLTLEGAKSRILETIKRDETGQDDQRVLDKLLWMKRFVEASELKIEGSFSIVLNP